MTDNMVIWTNFPSEILFHSSLLDRASIVMRKFQINKLLEHIRLVSQLNDCTFPAYRPILNYQAESWDDQGLDSDLAIETIQNNDRQ